MPLATPALRLHGGPRWLTLAVLLLSSAAALGRAPALAQESEPNVRDIAGMFDLQTVRQARSRLERLEREYHVPVLIETVDSLDGEPVDDVAKRRFEKAGGNGLYLLIARENRRISHPIASGASARSLTERSQEAIREAFIAEFKKADFDAGLLRGIEAIERFLADARHSLPSAPPESRRTDRGTRGTASEGGAEEPELVVRNRVHLTLAGARRVIRAAEAKAEAMKLKVNIAVVDDGGHMLAFERMDGARPASGYTALTKATTAATFRAPSGPVPPGTRSPDPLLNLSLQNAAAASGGKLTTLYGGVPIVVDDQVIGAVGVGGGTGEQDAEVARAGVAGLLDALNEHRPDPKSP